MNCEFSLPSRAPLVFVILDERDFQCKKCASSKDLDSELCKKCARVFKNLEGAFKCFKCGSTSTPVIRRGPDGLTNLCNKCGLAWKRALKNQNKI